MVLSTLENMSSLPAGEPASSATGFEIGQLAQAADGFQATLAAAKQQVESQRAGSVAPGWYPYDSLGSFALLADLLQAPHRDLQALAEGLPILDVGCADGAMALFLASRGFALDVVDNPDTNYNEMRGVRQLNDVLQAGLTIWEADLDQRFPPHFEKQYGLCLCMGLLYHLKNPFLLLERLSQHARYLVLTTRIARRAPGQGPHFGDLPLAYLVDEQETNQDATNFWIFSEAGVRRLLRRSGWNILQATVFGNADAADPASAGADARFFCLAESRRPMAGLQLLAGFHPPAEGRDWRWTEQEFSLAFARAPQQVTLRLHYPDSSAERLGPNELVCLYGQGPASSPPASHNQPPAQRLQLPHAGDYTWVVPGGLHLKFRLQKALAAGEVEARELGLIVASIQPEGLA